MLAGRTVVRYFPCRCPLRVRPPYGPKTFYPNFRSATLYRASAWYFSLHYPLDRGSDLSLRYLSGLHGRYHGIVRIGLLLRRAGDDEQVRPGLHGLHRRPGGSLSAVGPLHRQVVRDDDALEAE